MISTFGCPLCNLTSRDILDILNRFRTFSPFLIKHLTRFRGHEPEQTIHDEEDSTSCVVVPDSKKGRACTSLEFTLIWYPPLEQYLTQIPKIWLFCERPIQESLL
mmetsp:Transcript_46346/g.72554  ORF Transcript_46346/g.72554 Transcript_46346/m.72554 type:complete len:105 (+) Transcript_46346:1153-1467(+)